MAGRESKASIGSLPQWLQPRQDESSDNPPLASLIWLAIAGGLLLLELVGAEFDGWLVGAVVALLLSIITALVPLAPALQGLLAAILAGAGYTLLWRWSHQRRRRALPQQAGQETAEVITGFDRQGQGRVRWNGQSWAAESLEPERLLEAGQQVTVMGREGNRLQILPR
ncbi:NfeD family protein [Synechococcus sp. CBW1002]|nr:NfeD family protein [Synechococcus sp. CBW1002]QPN66655.1 NfeD family protein [Synechococcus sp. CBW1006]